MKHFKVLFKTCNPIRELFPDKNKTLHFWQCTHRDTIEGGGGIFRISFLKAKVSNSKNAKHKTNIETQMYFFYVFNICPDRTTLKVIYVICDKNFFFLFIYTVSPLNRYGTRFLTACYLIVHCT